MKVPERSAGKSELKREECEQRKGSDDGGLQGVCELIGARLEPERDVNLYSFVVCKGAYVLMLEPDEKDDNKRTLLEQICSWLPEGESRQAAVVELKHTREHLARIARGLQRNGYRLKLCRIESAERVLVRTGEAFGRVPFEIGLAFDPVLNVPYIPASSLKGAFRQALELKWGEEGRRIAEIAFGSKREAGVVGVTDAYPVQINVRAQRGARPRLFDPDVIAPHYPGKELEIDVQPIPNVFVTIAPGVVFEFYVYYNKELRSGKVEASDRVAPGKHIYEGDLAKLGPVDARSLPAIDFGIIYALTKGVGAKTSLGYSRFKLLEFRVV